MTTDQLELEGFVDDSPVEQASPPVIIDRSTLERWGDCPHQAWHVERGGIFTGSIDADVGNEVHAILSRAVAARHEGEPAGRIRDLIEELAMQARPDIQPRVLAAAGRKWPLVSLICNHGYGPERAPEDILRFDGGPRGFEGQLAADILPEAEDCSRGPIRLTCEVDLLMATASPEELDLVDWKSGWRRWTAGDVLESFQFNFYAWVILHNYPKVNTVRVRVWMTRDGEGTGVVSFRRQNMYQIGQRLLSAVHLYLQHRDAAAPENVTAWPAADKCSLCPAATRCVLVHAPEADVAKDERAYLAQYVAIQAAADRMADVLAARVRKLGVDIEADGMAFGTGAPTAARAKPCKLYQVKAKD